MTDDAKINPDCPALAAVWVETDRTADDRYIAAIHFTDDLSLPLDRDQAIAYAVAVIEVAGEAEHDAAVIAQLTDLSVEPEVAACVILELREAREPRQHRHGDATGPVEWTPIVSARNRAPYIQGHINGKPLTQWTPDDARGHALHVLEAALNAPLDTAYFRTLTTTIGLPSETARNAVHALRDHREPGDETDPRRLIP